MNPHNYLRDFLNTLSELSNQDDLTHLLPQNRAKQFRDKLLAERLQPIPEVPGTQPQPDQTSVLRPLS